MALVPEITTALEIALKRRVFAQQITVHRKYLPEHKLKSLTGIRVTVVARGKRTTQITRAPNFAYEVLADVAVQSKVDPNDNAAADALAELVEEMEEFLDGHPLEQFPSAEWIRPETTIIYIPEHLSEYEVYTAVLKTIYQVYR